MQVVRLGGKQGKVTAQVKGTDGAKSKWKSAGKKIMVARRTSQAFAGVNAEMCAQELDGAQLSVACVFFTQHTPKFGQHGINPDTGKCWCHNLYGESKCWGCQVSSV
jgi:hypothetical protein